jgi:hypothetical protein
MPATPNAKMISLQSVFLDWGTVTRTPLCGIATVVQMRLEGSSSWVTIYDGPSQEFDIQKLPMDISVGFRIRERNCAGVGPFSDELLIQTPSGQTT